MSSPRPVLVFVNGHPGTGKTYLASHLGAQLQLPVVSKDVIKEQLFDSLGTADREWSKRLGRASIEVMFGQVQSLLRAGGSLIVEGPFLPEFDDVRVQRLERIYGCLTFQILLTCQPDVLFGRYRQRALSDARHQGHGDADFLIEMRGRMARPFDPLRIGGETMWVDTTDFSRVDSAEIVARVRALIPDGRPEGNSSERSG